MQIVITKLTTALTVFIMLYFTSCGTSHYGASENDYNDNSYEYNPAWVPDYYFETRYYYFSDIETYAHRINFKNGARFFYRDNYHGCFFRCVDAIRFGT